MIKIYSLLLSTLCLIIILGCSDNTIPIPPKDTNPMEEEPELEGVVAVWRSDKDGGLKLAKEANDLSYDLSAVEADVNIAIDADTEYQVMEGFGASLTGSSAFVINTHLDEVEQDELLRDLFDPEIGIGISYIRLTIGASDFSLSDYSYNDLGAGQSDVPQNGFDLSVEDEHLVPILQKILAINPELRIMATPWSAPAWMKSNDNLDNGGRLKGLFQESYATYFVKYIKAMADRNIPIHAITVQNEPLYAAPYVSMEMSSEEQNLFIRDFLGPKFEVDGIDTKIILYDHNWDDIDYSLDILEDANTKKYVSGTAFHCYAGEVEVMAEVHNRHPDAGIYFTECSGGDFAPDYSDNLSWNTDNLIVGATRNWSKTVLFWNLALDQNHGPKNGGCDNCRGVVTVNTNGSAIVKNEEYVLLGHIAKFVRPGAVRIKTPDTRGQDISQVAFKNTDGSIAIIAYNHRTIAQNVQFQYGEERFTYSIDGGMLVTFVIKA